VGLTVAGSDVSDAEALTVGGAELSSALWLAFGVGLGVAVGVGDCVVGAAGADEVWAEADEAGAQAVSADEDAAAGVALAGAAPDGSEDATLADFAAEVAVVPVV